MTGRVNLIVPLTAGVTHVEAGMPLRALLAAKAAVTGRTLVGPPIFTDMPHKQGDTHTRGGWRRLMWRPTRTESEVMT